MLMILARLRRAFHWWRHFFQVLAYVAQNNGEVPPMHQSLTSWDPGRPVTDISCSCGEIFWTRKGYFTKRPKDWAKLRTGNGELTCASCGVAVRPTKYSDGTFGVAHDWPVCDWFLTKATVSELNVLAKAVKAYSEKTQ
jgi:hypothetical protein